MNLLSDIEILSHVIECIFEVLFSYPSYLIWCILQKRSGRRSIKVEDEIAFTECTKLVMISFRSFVLQAASFVFSILSLAAAFHG